MSIGDEDLPIPYYFSANIFFGDGIILEKTKDEFFVLSWNKEFRKFIIIRRFKIPFSLAIYLTQYRVQKSIIYDESGGYDQKVLGISWISFMSIEKLSYQQCIEYPCLPCTGCHLHTVSGETISFGIHNLFDESLF